MKRGQKVVAIGYKISVLDDKKKPEWPSFLRKGVHQISIVKTNLFGMLVKTDIHPEWINADWFAAL